MYWYCWSTKTCRLRQVEYLCNSWQICLVCNKNVPCHNILILFLTTTLLGIKGCQQPYTLLCNIVQRYKFIATCETEIAKRFPSRFFLPRKIKKRRDVFVATSRRFVCCITTNFLLLYYGVFDDRV